MTQLRYTTEPINISSHNTPVKENYGDIINQLPSDKDLPTQNEMLIVDKFFKQKKNVFERIFNYNKEFILLAVLFIIFSLPIVESTLSKFIPIIEKSPYISILIRSAIFVITYFIIKHLYLVRKPDK